MAPDPGRGAHRRLVGAAFAVSFVLVGGVLDTLGVFLHALAQAESWPSSTLSLGVSAGALAGALATPAVGAAVDRSGARIPMLMGTALLAAGFAVLLVMRSPWHFVAANLLLGPGLTATALLPLTVVIAVRMPERTATALGVAGTGSSLGALACAPAAQLAIESLGWRGAYALFGGIAVAAPLVAVFAAVPPGRLANPEAPRTPRPGLRALARRDGIRPLFALMVLPALTTFAVSVHLVPLLAASGLSDRLAATALGATIGVSAAGKVAGGWLADALGRLLVVRLALGTLAAGVCLLLLAPQPACVGLFVLGYGIALGAHGAALPALAREVLGERDFGAALGALQLTATLAAGLGPVLAGALAESPLGFPAAIAFWAAVLLTALGATTAIRPAAAAAVPETAR